MDTQMLLAVLVILALVKHEGDGDQRKDHQHRQQHLSVHGSSC